jgi:pimeloyl-ACP methyl ester carboxylesterase
MRHSFGMPEAAAVRERAGSFKFRGQRLAYTEFGDGKRWVVLLPGLLLPALMQEPLARNLAARGNHVITLDPLGHGRSDRPVDMWRYMITAYAQEVIALLDHLDVDEAVIGGTSLGSNVTLEMAAQAPQRVRGMVIEMPVLENGLVWSAMVFGPLLIALHFGERLFKPLAAVTRRIPRGLVPFWGNVALDVVRQDPGPSAALLQGLFFGHVAPHRDIRRTFTMPALILGHRRDPVHMFADAGVLADELPNARLIEASNILELRFRPERLSAEIADFVNECWAPRTIGRQRPTRTRRRSA